jgi:hypothetical protein
MRNSVPPIAPSSQLAPFFSCRGCATGSEDTLKAKFDPRTDVWVASTLPTCIIQLIAWRETGRQAGKGTVRTRPYKLLFTVRRRPYKLLFSL